MKKIIEIVLEHHKAVLIIFLLLSIPLIYFYAHQEFFNHVDIYFNSDDEDIMIYKKFQETFGNEEMAVISLDDSSLFTNENIEIIRKISQMAESRAGVQRVLSLTTAEEAVGRKDGIIFEKVIPPGPLTESELLRVREKILAHRLLANHLISRDGTTAAILIELDPIRDNARKKKILLDIKESALAIAGGKMTARFSGSPYVEIELNRLTISDTLTFTPLILIIIFIIVTLLLRRASLSLLCLAGLVMTIIWAVGLMVLCGETLNIVTSIIAPVLLAISVADTIHLFSHYRHTSATAAADHHASLKTSVTAVWFPCLMTSLTTGIGFLSFVTSTIRPVKIVGIFIFIGVMIAYIISIMLLPAALLLLNKKAGLKRPSFEESPKEKKGPIIAVLQKAGGLSVKGHRAVTLIFVIFTGLTAIGIYNIKFETNFRNYLPEKSILKRDSNFIEEKLGGIIPIIFLIRADSGANDFSHPRSLRLLDEIQRDMMRIVSHFTSSFSVADYYKEINRAFNGGNEAFYTIPDSRESIRDYYELGEPEVLDRIITPDMREARISFQSTWGSNEEAAQLVQTIDSYMKEKLTGEFSQTRTGLARLYVKMGDNLKTSQTRSFLTAFIIIFFMMYLVCRNIKLTLISMVPNIFPILATLGLMGWLGIPLDVSTIMIASVTLGIAVDDTIHYLVWYRRNITAGLDIPSSIKKTFIDVGRPIIITSLVLFLGFFILILGHVKPTRHFGVLTALSMLFALMGDLIILPSLILFFKPSVAKER